MESPPGKRPSTGRRPRLVRWAAGVVAAAGVTGALYGFDDALARGVASGGAVVVAAVIWRLGARQGRRRTGSEVH